MKRYLLGSVLLVVFFAACHKKVDPVDGSFATVVLKNEGAKFVTDNVTVNPKDSLYFSFTITSEKNMKYVSIQRDPVNQTAFLVRDTLNASNAHSYTTVKRLAAPDTAGSFVYRIVAHDAVGTYIGHKDIVITVTPDFYYYPERTLYAPDSTAKTNKCYYSTNGGVVYSYADGSSKSASIDFAYFYDTTKVSGTPLGHTIYALNSTGNFGGYDISGWTKNATIFKKLASGTPNPTFAQVQSAGFLRTAGTTQLASGTTTKVTGLSTTSPANTVYFKTAAGKFGMILITFTSAATNAAGGVDPSATYIKIDVKVEK